MTTTIRELQGDEIFDIMHRLPSYAFRSTPPLPDKEERAEQLRQRIGHRYFAAFEDGNAVACAAAVPLTQNVRGTLFPITGIGNVATHPAARRKGYARAVVGHLLATLRESGHAFSCLHPFRESFYERLGYAVFPQIHKVTLDPAVLLPLLKREPAGTVELQLIGDGLAAYREFLARLRQRMHGMAMFDHPDWAGARLNPQWLALARTDGETTGAMLYDLKGERMTQFTMQVTRFYYLTSQAKYLLLAWIARHTDQANRVQITLPAGDHPETWADDLHVAVEAIPVTPMGRVLDIARMGGQHTGPGGFTARIKDALCPWNEGVWRFETVDGVLQVGPAQDADAELQVQALAALAYGTQDPGDFAVRGWGQPSLQVQETMRTMFPPLLPHINEYF